MVQFYLEVLMHFLEDGVWTVNIFSFMSFKDFAAHFEMAETFYHI